MGYHWYLLGGAPEWSEARDHEATTRRHMRACGQTEQTDRQEKMECGAERPAKEERRNRKKGEGSRKRATARKMNDVEAE